MIVPVLFFWFIPPLLIGVIGGMLTSFTLNKIYEFVVYVRELNKNEASRINSENFSKCINKNLKNNNFNSVSIRDFITNEDGVIYTGYYNKNNDEVMNVSKVNYDRIDSSLKNDLKKENIILW